MLSVEHSLLLKHLSQALSSSPGLLNHAEVESNLRLLSAWPSPHPTTSKAFFDDDCSYDSSFQSAICPPVADSTPKLQAPLLSSDSPPPPLPPKTPHPIHASLPLSSSSSSSLYTKLLNPTPSPPHRPNPPLLPHPADPPRDTQPARPAELHPRRATCGVGLGLDMAGCGAETEMWHYYGEGEGVLCGGGPERFVACFLLFTIRGGGGRGGGCN